MTARIVLLNGVGSVGKSSIAKALQGIARMPLLDVQMDAFLAMLPDAYLDHPDGLRFIAQDADGFPEVAIHSGPVLQRVMLGMRHAVAALAAAGNDMIVDEVMIADKSLEYQRILAPFQLFRVGVRAPLEVLEARERDRGDRLIGLARWQFPRVHLDQIYDLEVDTSTATPEACALAIAARFGL